MNDYYSVTFFGFVALSESSSCERVEAESVNDSLSCDVLWFCSTEREL